MESALVSWKGVGMDEGKEDAFDRREMVCDHWNHSVMGETSGYCVFVR